MESQEVYNAMAWWPASVVRKRADPYSYEVRQNITSRGGSTHEFALKFEAVRYDSLLITSPERHIVMPRCHSSEAA